ncbi:MAG: ABC transporter ATP-binding protein [Gallionellales bacterium 35-53-114]|jgi:putative ATP-binding cassette transporter|nr:MAG: ABC transporter ATP-binding protein [Gallionellales bacterium 35-53-114]OYZ63212.1 MAG: ABC transporter ATP-binding protein [Gallionellales bacterium 24-53-125]OZB08678.1 MAG: ABC transporter ATP-binding protein [Gallionellales bacterium 39-52-133]HQS57463.1 ABC transporter ATP-binding protein/permease [Gallionellaceae bacterium]HQS74349.1 ABC transporter ATP-binding protein/permease [Gallionellaceae bacterium]
MNKFNRHLWKQFWEIARPYWFSDDKWKARGMLVLLGILLLGQTEFNVLLNEQTGEFTSALAAKDADRFWYAIKYCLFILIVAVPIYAFYYYVRDKLAVNWRQWITHKYLDNYFSNRAYYKLVSNAEIDNPDQRIAEDINTFTQRSLYFFLIIIGEILQLVAFSSVLWTISKSLVFFLIIYAIAGTVITLVFFGKVLIGLNFYQLKREADFRFSLIRIRENAESIALYRGEEQESAHVKKRFHEAFLNYCKLIKWQLNLNLFQYAYSFLTIILPSAIIASQVLSGELEVGRAIQAAGAFAAILSALAVIVDNFESLSRFFAGIDRLSTFSKSLNVQVSGKPSARQKKNAVIHSVQDSRLSLENLTLQTPDYKRTLITNLTLEIKAGESLLIVGASGEGKSSLLRALAGLWDSGSGIIVRPSVEDMLFLPQHPYMILGNLRSQLLYPNTIGPHTIVPNAIGSNTIVSGAAKKEDHGKDRKVSDDELYRLLDSVNLPHLAERLGGLNADLDWGKVLSVGEQQRLAMARVLLSQPRYVMLDEATSALDTENEDSLYRQLMETATTLVSISHRETVLKYHHHVLELTGHGNWQLHAAKDFTFKS